VTLLSPRHVDRYAAVTAVLARHGLEVLGGHLGLGGAAPGAPGPARGAPADAVQLREALEELGPTFIKLGQLLSTRPDVVPPAYVAELAKLQTGAPPVPTAAIVAAVEQELGRPVEQLFAAFDQEPLASASIGQAHAATLHDGTAVVVKVRRPGAPEQVNLDLEVLEVLAARASRLSEEARRFDVTGIVAEFDHTLRAELDYRQEARNAERFQRDFADDPGVHIPAVFADLSTSRVLTLERLTGVQVDDLEGLDRLGVDRRSVPRRAVDVIARMVFDHGFFHADPHPGNVLVEPGGRIALLDFGMVGTLDRELRERLADLFVALVRNDANAIATAFLKLCASGPQPDRERFRADIARFTTLYHGKSLAEVSLGLVLTRLLAILRRHRIRLRSETAMLTRMLLMVEGLGVRLDPSFELSAVLQPYATALVAERYSPAALARRATTAGLEALALSADAPQAVRNLFDLLGSDGVQVHLRADELEPLVSRLERIGNRLVAGTIAAALIGGIGTLTAGRTPARRWDRPLLAFGVGAVGALSGYLAITARHGRSED
jgi:ubiquinone biosynthesis protein